MQATLTIDDDLFTQARRLAATRSTTVDAVISDLLRRPVESASSAPRSAHEMPTFPVSERARKFGRDDVYRAEQEL